MKIIPLAVFAALVLSACATKSTAPASAEANPASPPAKMAAPAPAAAPVAAQPAPAKAPAPATVPGTIDFDMQVKPFFAKYCFGCHDANGRSAGVGYDNKTDILKTVTPGSADDSDLYYVLSTREMPRGGAKPSAAEIEMIRVWINEGAYISASYPATR